MVSITAPGKDHLFVLTQWTLVCWVSSSPVASGTSREPSAKLPLSNLVVSLWAKSIIRVLVRVRTNVSSGCATSSCSWNHVMVSSTVNLAHFCVKKGKNHLWPWDSVSLRSLLAVIRLLISRFRSVVWLDIEIGHRLLLSPKLPKIVTAHSVNKATWS